MAVTPYIYDNEDILLELDGSNNITARYTHGPGIDEPLIMEKAGASFFYHADGLGSITEITDSLGALKQRYTYSSFGKIESTLDPNFIQPYTFTAREFDPETGLHFYRARYYDPGIGRFLQEDPDPGSFINPSTLNKYSYVVNNPVKFVDPSGERGGVLIKINRILKDAFKTEQARFELVTNVAELLANIVLGIPLGTAAIILSDFISPSEAGLNDATEQYLIQSRTGQLKPPIPIPRIEETLRPEREAQRIETLKQRRSPIREGDFCPIPARG